MIYLCGCPAALSPSFSRSLLVSVLSPSSIFYFRPCPLMLPHPRFSFALFLVSGTENVDGREWTVSRSNLAPPRVCELWVYSFRKDRTVWRRMEQHTCRKPPPSRFSCTTRTDRARLMLQRRQGVILPLEKGCLVAQQEAPDTKINHTPPIPC